MAIGASFLSLALLLLFVLVPLVAGIWLIVKSRSKGLGFPGCGHCRYDLSGTLGTITRCPECGSDLKQVGVLPAQSSKNKGTLAAGILLLCVPLLCVGTGVVMSLMMRSSVTAARQAAAAAQAQAMQRTTIAAIASSVPDPAKVAEYRQQHASLTIDEASERLGEVVPQLTQAINDLDEPTAIARRAEQQALIDHINELGQASPPPTPSSP